MGDDQIHWFSIINSLAIVLLLTGIVAMIMMRTLRRDFNRYNEQDKEDLQEESGWKLVHADVFRSPPSGVFLCASLGTGVQVSVALKRPVILAALLPTDMNYLPAANFHVGDLHPICDARFSIACKSWWPTHRRPRAVCFDGGTCRILRQSHVQDHVSAA